MTPEGKVKAKVKKLLVEHGAYFFMPIGGPFATQGIPDIICCIKGRFVGIECKANGGRITALQERNLDHIQKNGGVAILVDETGIGLLGKTLAHTEYWSGEGIYYNYSRVEQ